MAGITDRRACRRLDTDRIGKVAPVQQEGESMTEKLITVEVVKPYRDLEKLMLYHPGETHEVTQKRADELVKRGFVKKVVNTKSKEPDK